MKKRLLLSTDSHPVVSQKGKWRSQVNDFVLDCFGKIYSPKHAKKKAIFGAVSSLMSFRSAPVSPTVELAMSRSKKVMFAQVSAHTPNQKKEQQEAINIKFEIKKAKQERAEEKLKMGYSKLKSMESMKLKKASKLTYSTG